ncbi:MAG: PIN domain nuclease [Treponema sp.]
MILLDTSVLIDYLKDTENAATNTLDEIIDNNLPYGICDYVYQELLQGTKTEKDFKKLKEYLETLPFYYLNYGKESFERAALLNFKCRRTGVTIRSTIDLLIAETAIENNLYLLHNDADFDNMAKKITELKIYKTE